jgi:hypothetical protein
MSNFADKHDRWEMDELQAKLTRAIESAAKAEHERNEMKAKLLQLKATHDQLLEDHTRALSDRDLAIVECLLAHKERDEIQNHALALVANFNQDLLALKSRLIAATKSSSGAGAHPQL